MAGRPVVTLADLSPARRAAAARDLVILAAHWQGCSERLIAEAFGASRATVRRVIEAAKAGPPKD